MQLRDIHYVLAVADEGSFSKAALKVHVSQPALSQLIQRLEDELGVKLFVRKSSRVTLTPAGKIFYGDGKVILALSEQLTRKMSDFNGLRKGELTIGYMEKNMTTAAREFLRMVQNNLLLNRNYIKYQFKSKFLH